MEGLDLCVFGHVPARRTPPTSGETMVQLLPGTIGLHHVAGKHRRGIGICRISRTPNLGPGTEINVNMRLAPRP